AIDLPASGKILREAGERGIKSGGEIFPGATGSSSFFSRKLPLRRASVRHFRAALSPPRDVILGPVPRICRRRQVRTAVAKSFGDRSCQRGTGNRSSAQGR